MTCRRANERTRCSSGRQSLAALTATGGQNRTAGAGAHTQPEAVDLRATAVVRLESTLAHEWAPGLKVRPHRCKDAWHTGLACHRSRGMRNSRHVTSRPSHVRGQKAPRSNRRIPGGDRSEVQRGIPAFNLDPGVQRSPTRAVVLLFNAETMCRHSPDRSGSGAPHNRVLPAVRGQPRRSYPRIHRVVFHRRSRVHSMRPQVPLGCGQRLEHSCGHAPRIQPCTCWLCARKLCTGCGSPVDSAMSGSRRQAVDNRGRRASGHAPHVDNRPR